MSGQGVRVKVVSVPFDSATGEFDEAELVSFQADHEILEASTHFFELRGEVAWAIALTYRAPVGARSVSSKPNKRSASEVRGELPSDRRDLFEALRLWRNKTAETRGKPVYTLFSNNSLAAIAERAPGTLAELREVPGVGDAKLALYGEPVLALVAAHRGRLASNPPADGASAAPAASDPEPATAEAAA